MRGGGTLVIARRNGSGSSSGGTSGGTSGDSVGFLLLLFVSSLASHGVCCRGSRGKKMEGLGFVGGFVSIIHYP